VDGVAAALPPVGRPRRLVAARQQRIGGRRGDRRGQLVAEWHSDVGHRANHRLLLVIDERVPAPLGDGRFWGRCPAPA
jgi:hypothetical protein